MFAHIREYTKNCWLIHIKWKALWKLCSVIDMKWQFSKKHLGWAINNGNESSLWMAESISFFMTICCQVFMCVDDYLIKRTHYFYQGKVALLATHQILTRALCHPLFKANIHTQIGQPWERSSHSHSGRVQCLLSIAMVQSIMFEAIKRPMRKCAIL